MDMHRVLSVLSGAAVLMTVTATAAGAAPLANGPGGMAVMARGASAVEPVATRRCYSRNGARAACRRNAAPRYAYRPQPGDYGPTYGNPVPESLPIGSIAWWEAMERWGRTGGRIR